jgi:hypothetical protein
MDRVKETLQGVLDRVVPGLAESFYRMHVGFQDPVGDGRRLIGERGLVQLCAHELRAKHPALDICELVIDLLDNVPHLPVPISADYTPFRNANPFPPHLVCYALAYIKQNPEPRFTEAFTIFVIRTGWWAGDENCIDDILDVLPSKAEVCKIAAASLSRRLSPQAIYAAGQLLYHLRYGEDWGLRDYVKEQYEKASRILTDPEDVREIQERLKSGLKPWKTIRA